MECDASACLSLNSMFYSNYWTKNEEGRTKKRGIYIYTKLYKLYLMRGMRMAYWLRGIRIVEEDVIAFNVKERVLWNFLKKCIRILIQKKKKSDDEPLQAQPSYYNFGKLDLAKIKKFNIIIIIRQITTRFFLNGCTCLSPERT